MKKSASKELTFNDFDKCLHNVTKKPITIKQTNFRSYNYQICTGTSNKIAICNPNKNDKECQDNDGKTTCFHGSNFTFIEHFDDKDITNSTEELKKIYKEFYKSYELWRCCRRKHKSTIQITLKFLTANAEY